jgi:hypothetical protein
MSPSRSFRPGKSTARLLGTLILAALALPAMLTTSAGAEARSVCGERGQLLSGLAQKHAETPQAVGLSADGGVIEVLVSPEGGWTILVTYPNKPTCVVAVGEAWQSLHHLVGRKV